MCYLYIQNVLAFIINAFDEMEINEINIFGENFNPFTEIFKFDTLDEIESWLKECCKNLTDYIISQREDFCKTKVLNAKEFIKNNFQDPNLSLNTVCNNIFISTSYFSLIFKKYTDITFIEYLINFRIEKAKELLKTTSLRSSEIAYKVGYNDPHYFSAAFKKNTGYTPTDFRKNLIVDSNKL
jgi:two-component system response regulator YesN